MVRSLLVELDGRAGRSASNIGLKPSTFSHYSLVEGRLILRSLVETESSYVPVVVSL